MATIEGEYRRVEDVDHTKEKSADGSGSDPAQPQGEVHCRNPECKATAPCGRHRCDYPGAGS
ncbi:MAG: hypothetical protein QG650_1009 [Patescibacteria group bacterium]|nr:hypothetical protein [Patescibacteria group bacterium]